MTIAQLAERLTAVESELAALRARKHDLPPEHPIHAWERIHNTFPNDDAYKEAARLGRKWRDSDRPKASKSKGKRK